MCKTEKILVRIGAFRGKCPYLAECEQNLPGELCQLAIDCEALDKSKQPEIKIIPSEEMQKFNGSEKSP